MNLFILSALSCGIASLVLCLSGIIFGKRKEHRIWVLFNVAVAFWGFGTFFAWSAFLEVSAVLGWKIALVGGPFIGVFFYHLICIFCEIKRKKLLYFIYAQTIIFSVLAICTDFVVNKTRIVFGIYYPRTNPFLWGEVFAYMAVVSISYYELFKYYRLASNMKRIQAAYLIFGFMFGFLGGGSTLLPLLNFDVYPIGNFGILVYCFIVAYAILRHRLLDIRIAFSKTAIYIMISACMIGIPVGYFFINTYALAGISLAVTCFILALITLVYAKEKIHYLIVLFNIYCFIWGVGAFIVGQANTPLMALLGWKFTYAGGLFIGYGFYHLVVTFCNLKRRWLLWLIYGHGLIIWGLDVFTDFYISPQLRLAFGSLYYFTPNQFFSIYLAVWVGIVILSFIELIRFIPRVHGIKRTQSLYVFFGFLSGFLGGCSTIAPVYGIDNFYPGGNFGIVLYSLIVTYAILRHSLMDIRIAGARVGIFILVYAFILGLPFGLAIKGREWLIQYFGVQWWWMVPLTVSTILATAGPFIYQIFRKRAENAILREERRYQHKLRDISATMLLIKELDRLLKTITLKVMAMVRISWAAVYLFDEKNKLYKLMFKKIRKGTENIAFPEEFAFDSPFATRLSEPCLPIIGEELDGTGIKVGLSVPCFIDLKLHGFMLLGEKLNKAVYTQDDVNVFAVLANQTALAIENCQFHLQEKYLHHAKRLESLDRQMASMAHEIDNPIQCINGNTYDVEICCNEFRSSMSPEKRQEYDSAVKQIKFNTGRISKMIGAVSAYSKADNDEVRIVGLHEILEDVYQITFAQFKTNAVTYTQDYPEDHVWLRVNKIEVEQVLVNLATNSIHAVAGKWKTGKNLPGEKKEVKLKAYKMDNGKTLRMDFSDNGYGIKKGIQEDIFLDFVTTKASTEGTGLGLSISRKLVAKYKGKIWAESEGENKGATVHVEIPIPDDITGQEIEAQKKELNEDKIRYAF